MDCKGSDFWLGGYNVENEILFKNYYSNDSVDLRIESDKQFNINENPKFVKAHTLKDQCNKFIKHIKKPFSETQSPKFDTDDKINNVIHVKYTYMTKESSNSFNNKNTENMNIEDSNKNDDPVTDLQKLLVMMALSSQTDSTETDEEIVTSPNENKLSHQIIEADDESKKLTSSLYKSEDINDILNIKQIRIEISVRQKQLLQKYTEKWRKYVGKKRQFWSQQRQNTLNTFLDKLKKKKCEINESSESVNKAKIFAKDYSTYQHRYKVQKHIIAIQKAKLDEQNRVIEELKYNKIIETSRESVDIMKDEVRKAYYEIDRKLKPKIKYLSNELKVPELDQTSLFLQCLKVPQFLQRMEKRAREREEKHAIIREKRRQMEEERLRLKQQAELAKIEMDKEEKVKRIKELRDKRKKEKIENIRRKQLAERMRALKVMADLHYEKYLMVKYGIRPLKKLIEIKQNNIELAKEHYKFQLKTNVFLHLMWYTEDMVYERNYKAEDFYRKKVLMKAFESFKLMHYEYICKRQVAEDYYDLYITILIFRKFREAIDQIKKENELKWNKVVAYHNSNLLFKTFTCWRTLPALNELKRQQDARKARWRSKVLLVVPDYTPPNEH